MPLGYKYAERDTESYVDWSAVGKNLSSALATEAQSRRDQIKTFEDQNVKDVDYLNDAPQGKFKDANAFTNAFAHDAKEQTLINKRLLETGQMSPRQFTLNRQNLMNGTEQLFDLQKTYQKEFDEVMEGVQSNDLQALNIAFMSMVEQFGDFTRSKGIINPLDGTVNIGMMAPNPKTGIMELTKDVMPVSVAKGKLTTRIKTFQVDEAIDKSVAGFGSRKEAIYNAASVSGAGTVRELTGIGAMERYPGYEDVIRDFNKAVDGTIASYFAGNSYNISSVLTQNIGGYDAKSFIYDKDEAAKDPTKILMKIDPTTKLPVLDESAPHYADQKKQAEEWVRDQIMNRLDNEEKVTTTSQLALNERRAQEKWQYDEKQREDLASNLAEQISFIVAGNPAQVESSTKYFAGKGVRIVRDKQKISVFKTVDKKVGDKVVQEIEEIPYYFKKNGQLANPVAFGKSLISSVDSDGLGENFVAKQLPAKFKKVGSTINTETGSSGYARKRDTNKEFSEKITTSGLGFSSNVFKNQNNVKGAMPILTKKLSGIKGLKIKPNMDFGNNDVTFEIGDKNITLNTNENPTKAQKNYDALVTFLNVNLSEEDKNAILGPDLTEQKLKAAEDAGQGELD